MAFTQSTPTSFSPTAAGSNVQAHTTGADDNYVVVAIYTSVHNYANMASAVTIDGVALTKRIEQSYGFAGQDRSVQMWYLLGDTVPKGGSYDVEITMAAALTVRATVYSGRALGVPTLEDYDAHLGLNASKSYSMDSGLYHGLMFGVFSGTNGLLVGIGDPYGDLRVTDKENVALCMVQDVSTTGERGWAYGTTTVVVSGSILIVESAPDVVPGRRGAVGGVRSGAITASGTPNLITGRIRPAYAGIRPGSIDYASQRQVLVVGGVEDQEFEQPETTEGGSEGDILMQHGNRKPTWESPGSLELRKWREPVRMDTDGDGVYDAWLLTDEGDVVMIERVAD